MADVSVKTNVAYCPKCRQLRPVWEFKINHTIHLVITLLTGGAWGLLWLVRASYNRWGIGWRCAVCNQHIRRSRVPK